MSPLVVIYEFRLFAGDSYKFCKDIKIIFLYFGGKYLLFSIVFFIRWHKLTGAVHTLPARIAASIACFGIC